MTPLREQESLRHKVWDGILDIVWNSIKGQVPFRIWNQIWNGHMNGTLSAARYMSYELLIQDLGIKYDDIK